MIGKTLGHYQITEKLGEGGMGVVYRAHDEHLQRDVAIKVLPSGTLVDEPARKRFRNEALALSRLNHSGIEAVYDFDSEGETDFLVMEYVAGTTLSDCLSTGPLPEAEVIRLGTQIAAALEEAHEKGVIHRDLKPANIILTPKKQIKVLDFGLAKLLRPTSATDTTSSVTETKGIAGTLPYMAPEQLRGEPVDARTDIYATGILLYEMATAQRPFRDELTPRLTDAILHQAPEPPSSVNRHVSRELEGVIVKAMDKEPERRHQSAKDLRLDLDRLVAPASPTAYSPRRVLERRWMLALSAIVVVILSVFLTMNVRKRWERLIQPTSPVQVRTGRQFEARRSVAVLGFKNLSGRPEAGWLSTAFSEMFGTELAAGEKLRTIPGENVARMKIELSLADADAFAKDTLARVRNNLGADLVVLGSYVALGEKSGGQIRLDLRLQDTTTGETIISSAETGTEAQLLDLVSRTGASLREKLGVGGLSAAETSNVRAALPSSTEVSRFYAEGLAKLRVFDALAARDLLEKAVAADPNYPVAHSALAAAWSALGYDVKAREEAKKAFDLSGNLSREERLAVEARYREISNDWDKAVEIYRTLFNFFPDNLDYGLRLARAQGSAGKGKDALATIELLRKFPSPQGNDPRIDLAEGQAARSQGDFVRIEALAAQAAAKGQLRGLQFVVAQARGAQCVALRHLGDPKKATPACEEARRIYAATGDRGGLATVLNSLANNLYDQGDLAGAKKLYEEALATYRQIGNKGGAAGALDNIANLLGDLGDHAGAKKLSEEALEMYREVSDYTGVGETLNNIAAEQLVVGDLPGAERTFQEALDIWRRTGDRNGLATTLNNLAEMQLGRGELAKARSGFEEALSTFRETGQKSKSAYPLWGLAMVLSAQGELANAKMKFEEVIAVCHETGDRHLSAYALFGLGSVLAQQGDLASARRKHEEAIAIRKEIGEKASEAESLLAVANLALEEGRPADADALARKALDEFHVEKLRDDEVTARTVLARSLLVQDKVAEAGSEIDLAKEFARRSHAREVRMNYAITAASVQAAKGTKSEAVIALKATLAEATTCGYRRYQLEARLGLGEIEVKSGQMVAGRSWLETLEKDANANGFLLIARKAAKARDQ